MELVAKAWKINPDNFKEPWFAPEVIFYADKKNEARKDALYYIRYDDYKTKYDDPIDILNIKIIRAKNADKYMLDDGTTRTKEQIDYQIKVDERNKELDQLLQDNPDALAYIRKGGYYYRSNHCGYTDYQYRAGVYDVKEAVDTVRPSSLSDYMRVIVINPDEHNGILEREIEDLKSRIILK